MASPRSQSQPQRGLARAMVRIKPLPERSNGRITMRETTTQVVREVRYEDDEPRQGDYGIENSPVYRSNSQYAVGYRSPPRGNYRDLYNQYDSSQLNASSSRNYPSVSEYMTDDQPYENSRYHRNHGKNEYRRQPLQSIQPDEYMRDSRHTTSSRLETMRDSSQPSDLMLSAFRDGHREPQRQLSKAEQLELSNRNRVDHYMNRDAERQPEYERRRDHIAEDGYRNRQLQRERERDTSPAAGRSTRIAGGTPRLRHKKSLITQPRRYRPGARALLEIRRLQKTTHNVIPKLSLQRVVREITADLFGPTYRFTSEALCALQEASEALLVKTFDDATQCATHAKRVTVMPRDFQLLRKLQRW